MEDPTPQPAAKPRAKATTPRKATKSSAKADAKPATKATTEAKTEATTKAATEAGPAKKATAARTATRRAPAKKAARPAEPQPVLDEALLSHLDRVLADLDSPMVATAPEMVIHPELPPAQETPAAPEEPRVVAEKAVPLWARLVADPGFAPEHLVRDAVRRTGPEAADWVDQMRRRYPEARADALARLASLELTRAARRAGALAVGAAAGIQVRLVLTVAAAYGYDPTNEARVRDVLDLLRVPRLTQPTAAALANAGRLAGAVALRRLAAKLVPFGAPATGAIHSGRTTADVGVRAMARFRPGSLKPWDSEERDLVV